MLNETQTIAIVDDEAPLRAALRRLLCSHGFEVELFPCGSDLLEAHANQAFKCIVLDLHMPEMSGFDVLAHLAAGGSRPPVVVITGHDQPGNADRVMRFGVKSYLVKPVDQAPLIEAIEEVLENR